MGRRLSIRGQPRECRGLSRFPSQKRERNEPENKKEKGPERGTPLGAWCSVYLR